MSAQIIAKYSSSFLPPKMQLHVVEVETRGQRQHNDNSDNSDDEGDTECYGQLSIGRTRVVIATRSTTSSACGLDLARLTQRPSHNVS